MATAHSHAGEPVGSHTPSLAAAYPGLVYEDERPGAPRRARPGVLRPAARGVPADRPRAARRGWAWSSTWPPTSGCGRRALPALVRRGARARPSSWPRPSTGCPSCSATTWPGPPSSPRPAATRRRPAWRWPRWCGRGLVEPTGIVVDAASGVSGAGRAPKESLHFGTVDEDFTAYGLLTHRHTPEMEQILGARGALHAAPRPDGPRHPRHLLRPARRRRRRADRPTPSWPPCTRPTTTSRSWS